MGAGSYPAGVGPAGFDPVLPPNLSLPGANGPRAAYFDPFTKSFPLDANGFLVSVHEVDQGVSLALGVQEASIASATTTGHTLRKIPRGSVDSLQRQASDRVYLALADWISRKDIEVLNVEAVATETAGTGRILAMVTYRNLRRVSSRPETVPTLA